MGDPFNRTKDDQDWLWDVCWKYFRDDRWHALDGYPPEIDETHFQAEVKQVLYDMLRQKHAHRRNRRYKNGHPLPLMDVLAS